MAWSLPPRSMMWKNDMHTMSWHVFQHHRLSNSFILFNCIYNNIKSYCHIHILLYCYNVILSYCHIVILLYTVIYNYIVIFIYCHILLQCRLLYCHIVILSYCYIVILLYTILYSYIVIFKYCNIAIMQIVILSFSNQHLAFEKKFLCFLLQV